MPWDFWTAWSIRRYYAETVDVHMNLSDGSFFRFGNWLLALPLPVCTTTCMSPLIVWWLLMLVKHRADRATFRRIALGGGGLLVTTIAALTVAGFLFRALAAPR